MTDKKINIFSGLLGYENTLPSEHAGKAVDLLSNLYLFTLWDTEVNDVGKEIISEAEFIAYCLQKGRMPGTSVDRRCYKCHKNNCPGKASCPDGKTVYTIGDKSFGMYITKTGYDFANYLIGNNLMTYEAVQAVINGGKVSNENAEPKKAPPVQVRQPETDVKCNTEAEYETWLSERSINYGTANVIEAARVNILREIFLDILWRYDDRSDKKLLVMIDGIENPWCRRDIAAYLQPGNKAGITAFEHITGIKLPKDSSGRKELLEKVTKADYAAHAQEYTPRNAPERKEFGNRFYTLHKRGDGSKGFVETRGKLWRYNGIDFFIHKDSDGGFKVSEGRTGVMVKDKCPTVENLKETVINMLAKMGTGFDDHVNSALQQSGVSPLYTTV